MMSVSSCVRIFVYILVMSKEANLRSLLNGIAINSFISWIEFLTLEV
jgi:hypothetical protein